MTRIGKSCIVLLAAVLATGCAAQKSSLTSPDFQDRVGDIKTVGVIVAEARILNLAAGGGTEENPEASARCLLCTESAVKEAIGRRGYELAVIPIDDDGRALLADYMKSRGDIFTPFPSNQGKVQGLPPLPSAPAVCAKYGVDGIVFVGVLDHVSTGGRKVFLGALALLGIVGGEGIAYADLSMVDGTGTFIYYDRKTGSEYTLTEDESVRQMVDKLVADIPQAKNR